MNSVVILANGDFPKHPTPLRILKEATSIICCDGAVNNIEEYGLIGASFLILLYLILLFRGIKIATILPNSFGSFLAVGCCYGIVFQALINMAVAVNIFPVTGQTLPLISKGGTSIWFTCIALGMILSVSREVVNEKNEYVNASA